MGVDGFPVASLFGGLAIVLVASWYSGTGEPLSSISWQPVRWCGPPGLTDFVFWARFLSQFECIFILELSRFEPASCEHGSVFTIRVSWLRVICGCLPGSTAPWQPSSRRCWSESCVESPVACVHGFRVCDAKR